MNKQHRGGHFASTAIGITLAFSVAACGSASAEPATPSPSPTSGAALSIPGIGATRHDWDASHTPNPGTQFDPRAVYGYDPTLPFGQNGAVYFAVTDKGTDRIQSYIMNMHPVDRDGALAQVRRELPADATIAWDLKKTHCYLVAFSSATLAAATNDMAVVELSDFLGNDSMGNGIVATNPDTFNQANFDLLPAGSPPNPEVGYCS